jgi:hypothetical protein
VRYALVFQFDDAYFASDAERAAFETRLRAALPRTCKVDGHDVQPGATNFFVLTPSPIAAHERFRRVATRALERKLRVSFRLDGTSEWMNLWPRRDARPFALTYTSTTSPFRPASKRAIPKRSKPGVSKIVTRARR